MKLKYRITKLSFVGLALAIIGVGVQLNSYSSYQAFRRKPEQPGAAIRPGQSFSSLKSMAEETRDRDKAQAAAKSSFQWGVGGGLAIILAGAVLMALPARQGEGPEPKRTSTNRSRKR